MHDTGFLSILRRSSALFFSRKKKEKGRTEAPSLWTTAAFQESRNFSLSGFPGSLVHAFQPPSVAKVVKCTMRKIYNWGGHRDIRFAKLEIISSVFPARMNTRKQMTRIIHVGRRSVFTLFLRTYTAPYLFLGRPPPQVSEEWLSLFLTMIWLRSYFHSQQ